MYTCTRLSFPPPHNQSLGTRLELGVALSSRSFYQWSWCHKSLGTPWKWGSRVPNFIMIFGTLSWIRDPLPVRYARAVSPTFLGQPSRARLVNSHQGCTGSEQGEFSPHKSFNSYGYQWNSSIRGSSRHRRRRSSNHRQRRRSNHRRRSSKHQRRLRSNHQRRRSSNHRQRRSNNHRQHYQQ